MSIGQFARIGAIAAGRNPLGRHGPSECSEGRSGNSLAAKVLRGEEAW
jgi:hypothetical protein